MILLSFENMTCEETHDYDINKIQLKESYALKGVANLS